MQIELSYDQAVDTLPAGFVSGLNDAADYLDALISNNITVNIEVGYGEITQNGQSTLISSGSEGGPDDGTTLSYAQLVADLSANSSSSADATALANLPATDPSDGAGIFVSSAQEKAWGFIPASGTEIDGSVGFQLNGANGVSYDFDPNDRGPGNLWDFIGVAEQELTHALGRISGLSFDPSAWTAFDLYRYSSPGVINHTLGSAAYFSIDGGATNLGNLATGDPSDWAGTSPDSFNFELPVGVENPVTSTDMIEMNVLGFNVSYVPLSPAVAVEATMYGAVGSAAEVAKLANEFLPGQVVNAVNNALNPLIYATEALGLAFAFHNENGETTFANNFGPSNGAMPNTTTGDAAFAAATASSIFGTASTTNLVNAIDGYVTNWKSFYTSNGVVGIGDATPAQIDLAARGAAWGDAVGLALANSVGPLKGQVVNFLEDAADGQATFSASLSSQHVGLTGIASVSDHSL
jgi:hypothetical protein